MRFLFEGGPMDGEMHEFQPPLGDVLGVSEVILHPDGTQETRWHTYEIQYDGITWRYITV